MAHIQPQAPTTLHDEETELQRIEAALKAAGGNKSKAAQLLAVDRKTLYNKMKSTASEELSPIFWGKIPHLFHNFHKVKIWHKMHIN